MSDRQCPSCGGFCKKSGCERLNTNHPDYDKTEWKVRGVLAESLKCWCRLTGEEAAELVKLFTETEAQAFAAGAASREDEIAQVRADRDGLYKEWEAAFGERAFGEVAAEVEALRADAGRLNVFEQANYRLIDEAVALKVRIDGIEAANVALVCTLDRIHDVLGGAYVDDIALIVNNALAKNKDAT